MDSVSKNDRNTRAVKNSPPRFSPRPDDSLINSVHRNPKAKSQVCEKFPEDGGHNTRIPVQENVPVFNQ